MSWLNRHEEFNLDVERQRELELEARQALGDERYEELEAGISTEVMRHYGPGDIPPGYNPNTDPMRKYDRRTARNILLGTLAATGVIGGAVIAYKKLSHQEDSNHESDAD